ncbi:MAG: hypothetical protein AAGE65_13010 [Planctomycetota bacterium]
MNSYRLIALAAVFTATSVAGCTTSSSFVTPGGPASLGAIAGLAEPSALGGGAKGRMLGEASEASEPLPEGFVPLSAVEPVAEFPVNMVAARVQAGNFRGEAVYRPDGASFSIVTARNVESDEALEKLFELPGVEQVQPMNRLLVPNRLRDAKDLRESAAVVKANMLLLYTFDTTFRQDDQDVGPLNILALGFLPNQKITVNSTASAVLIDTQSGFVYGVAEASADTAENTNIYRGRDGIDALRNQAEREAFDRLADEITRMWTRVFTQFSDT